MQKETSIELSHASPKIGRRNRRHTDCHEGAIPGNSTEGENTTETPIDQEKQRKSRSMAASGDTGQNSKVAGAGLETTSNSLENKRVSANCGAESGAVIDSTETALLELWRCATNRTAIASIPNTSSISLLGPFFLFYRITISGRAAERIHARRPRPTLSCGVGHEIDGDAAIAGETERSCRGEIRPLCRGCSGERRIMVHAR